MKLAIIGIQGSGKGTQVELITKKFKLKKISVGNLVRQEIKKQSRKGKILAKYANKGKLAPNRIINKIVLENTPKDNFIVDGFPRDEKQIRTAKKLKLDKVLVLTLPKKEVYKRLRKRRKLEGRIDDQEKAMDTRLKLFYKNSPKIIKHFKNKIIKINGDQTIKKELTEIILPHDNYLNLLEQKWRF